MKVILPNMLLSQLVRTSSNVPGKVLNRVQVDFDCKFLEEFAAGALPASVFVVESPRPPCDPHLTSMEYSPDSLLSPWKEFMPGQAQEFLREVHAELSPGHPLHGVVLKPLAHSGAADDALFQLEDSRVVEVHLTWSRHSEHAPRPSHRIYEDFGTWVEQVMIPAHEDSL
jgi:hypothetical protein